MTAGKPEDIAEIQRSICLRAKCEHIATLNPLDPCAECPDGHWGRYATNCDGVAPMMLPPTIMTIAKSAAGALGAVLKHGIEQVSDEEQARRLGICGECPHLIQGRSKKEEGRCGKCGCHLNWKTRLEAWHCPVGKW